MLDLDYDSFRVEYSETVLGPLDAAVVFEELHELAANTKPVLLCFERTPFSATNWCHRRMVADWFQNELGIEVPELA